MEKISVVVAVYNAEKYLRKCIDSLLAQTYENTEIILVNDCSNDNSFSICKDYCSKYENVIVFNNENNLGVSATRNKGLDIATGKYICFVDSDDYVEPKYLDLLHSTLIDTNTKLSICGCQYHNYIDNTNNQFLWNVDNPIEIVSLSKGFELSNALYLNALWNKLFITRLIKDNNIRFDENLSMGEDAKFSLEYIKCNNITEVMVLSLPLYHYIRWTDNSLMSNYYKKIEGDYLGNLNMLFDIVKPLNPNAKALYESEKKSIVNNLKYSVLVSKISKKEKKYYLKILYPDYSLKDSISDNLYICKEKLAKLLHR